MTKANFKVGDEVKRRIWNEDITNPQTIYRYGIVSRVYKSKVDNQGNTITLYAVKFNDETEEQGFMFLEKA